jgi:hypothetical protein
MGVLASGRLETVQAHFGPAASRRIPVNLSQLVSCHQAALTNLEAEPSGEARLWAEVCADYFGQRVVDTRDRLGVPIPTYHGRRRRS